MHYRGFGGAAVLCLLLACGACSEGTSIHGDPPFEIDTIAGIVHVKTFSPVWEDRDRWTVTEELRIGGENGSAAELFGNAHTGVAVAHTGGIYVLDGLSDEVRVFGADGHHVRTFGGTGEGPGELSSPYSLGFDEDERLWVSNAIDGRYTVFDSMGEVLATTPLRRRGVHGGGLYRMHFTENSVVDQAATSGGLHLVRRSLDEESTDTLGFLAFPYVSSGSYIGRSLSEEASLALRNFLPRLVWTMAPDGTLWEARTDSLRLIQRNFDGDTIRIIEAHHREPGFSSREEAVVEKARYDLDDPPEFVPHLVQDIMVLDDGHVLVQISEEFGAPGRTTDVFDPNGRYLGELVWPFAPHPRALHDFVGLEGYVVTLDELDVPYVTRVRLDRTGDG